MQALEDDDKFVMGHVLVGASQCLSPLVHQDSLDAVTALATAADIVQSKGKQWLAPMPSVYLSMDC